MSTIVVGKETYFNGMEQPDVVLPTTVAETPIDPAALAAVNSAASTTTTEPVQQA